MASSQSRSSERMIHQDYIARIRYSNALPPPPNPPKLLDIPNTGLSSGQYTTPGFASRLARDQPLNIEADAELGMPLDLVGMPGIFDGDESSIQAPLHPPPPHPHDRALLRPLSTLGKPKFSDSGVSFLRRTEYISSYTSKSRFDSTTSRSLTSSTHKRIKRPSTLDLDSPASIKEQIERSFSTAATYLSDPSQIRHPTKPHLSLVASYPLLPDHSAVPDYGGYVSVKFLSNPVAPSSTYDTRLEHSILRAAMTDDEGTARAAQRALHERDPEHHPPPDDTMEYEFFLADSADAAANFKRKLDAADPTHGDDALYTQRDADGAGAFRFKRVRAYESATMLAGEHLENEVVVALSSGGERAGASGKERQKQRAVAHWYPLVVKTSIGPQRKKNIDRVKFGMVDGEEGARGTDFVDLKVHSPTREVRSERRQFLPEVVREYLREEEGDEDEDGDGDADGDGDEQRDGLGEEGE